MTCEHCARPGRLRPDPDGDTRPRVLCRRCARAFDRFSLRQWRHELRQRDRVVWVADSPTFNQRDRATIAAAFDPASRGLPLRDRRWTPAQLELDLARRQARYLIARAV